MTRDEAEAEARRFGAEHPERDRFRWIAREAEGGWEVVRVQVPAGRRIDPLKTTAETKPTPEPADPRSAYERNVGGPWGAV